MGRYFGTDGFRGEANNNLTADHAYKIGRFLGWYYGEVKRRNGDDTPARIVIGKDTRRSSYMFEYTLVGGLVASGADAYLLHVTTTPSVAYVARTDGFDCGIMISASHNPYYDNGIKLINGNGEKMDEGTIALVEDYLDGKLEVFGENYEEIPFAHTSKIGRTVDYVSGRNRYIGYLISLGLYSFKGVKVGLDCANGSSWNLAKSVFDALGAKTYVINAEPDGTNINNNAGSTHIGGLQKFVVENGLDVGFAYDGDADRCLCVDEKGNLVDGDAILYIYGKYLTKKAESLNDRLGYVIPYADSPFDHENVGEEVYFHILNHAKKYVHIMTPYLILDNEMLTTLIRAAKSGIEVIIIMPHIPDKWYAFAVAKTYYKELIEGGVQIYEYTPGFVHAKVFVSDDDTATVGSINLDFRSLYLHFENGVFIYDNPEVQKVEEDFQNTLAKCHKVTVTEVRNRGVLMKVAGQVLRLVAPLM